ncbi:hypothetical protein DPMN_063699 [Dreissena polymorpha]|uniref:Uncharacterized protein n=1 Tax=Dreissena polymorpha TaxID=45954 RepID=A0A9D4CC26_DREPO|nr:hypothetical protein DPMN_063699 [Dreissena polymorpha]
MSIFARAIVKRSGRPTRKFFASNPPLKERRPDRAASGRMNISAQAVADYFKLLSSTIESSASP